MRIIRSLLDLDFYKLTMCQFAFLLHRNVQVRYAFKNRTIKVALSKIVDAAEVRHQIEMVRKLRFRPEEIAYLRKSKYIPKGMFCEKFLKWLTNLALPEVTVEVVGDQLKIETKGPWPVVILWETLILSIVNELYYREMMKRRGFSEADVFIEGLHRLVSKIDILRANSYITFIEFGTRRRFSHEWQELVIQVLKATVPGQLIGTSNVYFAMKFDLKPIGTFAHELDMVYSGIYCGSDEELRGSHNRVLEDWWNLYGAPLSIALTDTFGSKFFFEDMTKEQAEKWKGLRQDSGDPIEFGEQAIKFYKSHGIDPMTKLIVFSDGLDVFTIVKLAEHFKGRINVTFGWGTNLTNDVGFDTLSLVVKAVEANGKPLVKLSDNLAKAMGPAKVVERFKRVFGYTNTDSKECVV